MATLYHNIVGSTGVDNELLAPKSGISGIRSISITNTGSAATVSLFIQDNPTAVATSTFYLLKSVAIPAGVTLLLDNRSMLDFNKRTYGLYITVGGSDTVDVTIND
tara:strand:+ start:1325 stop:1642 length:318 start_codon:yes stop_codon:yes gene_type:complete